MPTAQTAEQLLADMGFSPAQIRRSSSTASTGNRRRRRSNKGYVNPVRETPGVIRSPGIDVLKFGGR